MVASSKEVVQSVDRSARLEATFPSLSDESQTFILGEAEGLRVAQTLLRGRLPSHGSPLAQEQRQKLDG